MNAPTETGVLIVGAGPTGLACANLLGLYGVRTLLIERNETTSQQPKGILIDDEFYRQFAMTGAAPALEVDFVPEVGVTFYAPAGFPLAEIKGHITPNGYPNRSAVSQPLLEAGLRAHVETWPCVRMQFSTALIALAQDGQGVRARVRTLAGEHDIHAAYVIGADGAHSAVREAAGIAIEGEPVDQPHVVVDVAADPDQVRFSRFFCHPARPRNSVPSPHGGRRYEFMILPGEDPRIMAEPAQVDKLMALARPGAAVEIVRKAVYYFHEKIVAEMRCGRVFLAGDAAHQMPPFGAQGMNSGGKDAVNLCWKLAMVLQGRAAPKLLETYHTERHAHAKAIIALSTRIGAIANLRSRPLALVRDGAFWLANRFPRVRDWFATQKYLPRQRYREGFVFDPPAPSDKDSYVGRMLPCPMVRDATGDERLLDAQIGEGFALIAIDAPAASFSRQNWRFIAPRMLSIGDGGLACLDNRFDALRARHAGEVLLVRPDRYVAAACPPDALDHLAERLGAWLSAAQALLEHAA